MQNEAITHVGIDMGMRNRVTASCIRTMAATLASNASIQSPLDICISATVQEEVQR